MPSGMPTLISSVSRSLIAPVLRSVQPARAVLSRPLPDLGSLKSQWFHGGCTFVPPADSLCRVSLASPISLVATGSLQIAPPLVHRDNYSRMIPGSLLGHGDTSMHVLGTG